MRLKRVITAFCFVLLGLFLIGCRHQEGIDDSKPVVYTSFYPIHNLVDQVAGDTVNVVSFMPKDQNAHFWEPTPRDMEKLGQADLLIMNGANLEKWGDGVRNNFPDLEILVLSDSCELITYRGAAAIGDFQYMAKLSAKKDENYTLSFGHTHENLMRIAFFKDEGQKYEDLVAKGKEIMEAKGKVVKQDDEFQVEEGRVYAVEMGHESGQVYYQLPDDGDWIFVCDRLSEEILSYQLLDAQGELQDLEDVLAGSSASLDRITYDPHSWLSTVNAKKYINAIFDNLAEKFPENRRTYQRNKVRAIDEISNLEFEYMEKFKEVKHREFVVTHNAYGYLAKDFDLRQFPLQELASTESPSLKTIRTALNFLKTYNIDTIYYELGSEVKSAQSLAEEINGTCVPLISMEYEMNFEDMEQKSFADIMRLNLERLYEGMK